MMIWIYESTWLELAAQSDKYYTRVCLERCFQNIDVLVGSMTHSCGRLSSDVLKVLKTLMRVPTEASYQSSWELTQSSLTAGEPA